jgi:hypothetical protein
MPRCAIGHKPAVIVLTAASIAGRAAGIRAIDYFNQRLRLCISTRACALLGT